MTTLNNNRRFGGLGGSANGRYGHSSGRNAHARMPAGRAAQGTAVGRPTAAPGSRLPSQYYVKGLSQPGMPHAGNGARDTRRAVLPKLLRQKPQRRIGKLVALALVFVMLSTWLLMVGASMTGVAIGYSQIANDLKPRLEALANHQPFLSTKIFDRNGTLLYEFFGEGRREPISLKDVSQNLINATIAIEDASFYENSGVDYTGITRAFYQNTVNKAEVSGASTITQQVVKNVLLTEEEKEYKRRYERKVKEIVLAQELTNIYTKDQILELYLNEIPYGNLAYGIQAAAKSYFGVDARDLTLAQASLLAGLPQSPTVHNPVPYLDENKMLPGVKLDVDWLEPSYIPQDVPPGKQRQVEVLRQMVREGYISASQGMKIAAQDLQFADQEVSLLAPHFVFFVRDYLETHYGREAVTSGGLRVYTTLDLEMQQIAQEQARQRIQELEVENRNIHNAAVVIMQPNTGQLLAMVGSIGYTMTLETTTPGESGNVLDGNVNVTTQGRQPGSALKPFNYLNGMEQNVLYAQGKSEYPGITPGTVIYDVDTRYPVHYNATRATINRCEEPEPHWYCPKNYTGKWYGPMRFRYALNNSLNTPAVKVLKRSGVQNFIDLLHRAGVAPTSLNRGLDFYGLSLTLGGGEVTPLDLATAYNTLASGGRYFPPTPILKITDANGKVLEEFNQVPLPTTPDLDTSKCVPPSEEAYQAGERLAPGTQCIDPRLAFILTNVMSDNKARTPMFGPENILILSQPAAVKTGTTNDFRDAWASGFTRFVTISVWTGNNNNEQTAKVESTTSGGHIWHRTMEKIFANPRLMQLLGEPFGGTAPVGFPDSFPGVEKKKVCHIGGNFGGPDEEFFIPEFRRVNYKENDGKEEVAMGKVGTLSQKCDPSPPFDPNNLVQPANSVEMSQDQLAQQPPPEPVEAEKPQPTKAPAPEASGPIMPELTGYGENQAKEILAGLGVYNVVVDYQGKKKLGKLYNKFPAYAVVSTVPLPGARIEPGMAVILGIRAP